MIWTLKPRDLLAGLNGGAQAAPAATGTLPADVRTATLDSIRALMLIRAYRVRGHLEAKLDPLGLKPVEPHPGIGSGDLWFHRCRYGPEHFH